LDHLAAPLADAPYAFLMPKFSVWMGFSMKKSDITCPECGAGFRRIELIS